MRLAFLSLLFCVAAQAEIPVIPRPLTVREQAVDFSLEGAAVSGAPDPLFLELLSAETGQKLVADSAGSIRFLPVGNIAISNPEGYVLRIGKTIEINAPSPAGHFYGLQTLLQLLRSAPRNGSTVHFPCALLADQPRFAWRGFMLDESRHFSGEAAVKRLIDAMARYKLNRLHWHLTDSAGWRIEIKRYPKLATTGGRGNETDRSPQAPVRYYTQEQIRDIVAYAKERHVTIIPEVDMPGHADAAIAAYPEHDGGGYLQKGSKEKWPHFTFNPAKPETLEFLDNILKEVAALFPDAGVIHIGGDEVHFGWQQWPELSEVKKLMEREKLKDLAAVEGWFIQRMAKSVNGLGFSSGGWDEIASRGLPADKTLIFWWRHDKPEVLKQALADGYPVVLCPRRPCYFDFVQDESHQTGRRWGGFNPLEDTYRLPADLKLDPADEKQVRGVEACLWTETCLTQARRDFMTWPRLVALAEAGWTKDGRKDFPSFQERLPAELIWLKAHGIQPYDPFTKSAELRDLGAKPDYPDMPE